MITQKSILAARIRVAVLVFLQFLFIFSFLMFDFQISIHTILNFCHILIYYSNNLRTSLGLMPAFRLPTAGQCLFILKSNKNDKLELHFIGLAMEQNTVTTPERMVIGFGG